MTVCPVLKQVWCMATIWCMLLLYCVHRCDQCVCGFVHCYCSLPADIQCVCKLNGPTCLVIDITCPHVCVLHRLVKVIKACSQQHEIAMLHVVCTLCNYSCTVCTEDDQRNISEDVHVQIWYSGESVCLSNVNL